MDTDLTNIWGEPTIYKGIKLYPIQMEKSIPFFSNVGCLTIQKNNISDIDIIQMSYLNFLLNMCIIKKELLSAFNKIMDLVLREQEIVFLLSNKEYNINNIKEFQKYMELRLTMDISKVKMKVYTSKDEVIITDTDFEKIRRIICEQNTIEIDDMVLPEKIQKAVEEAKEFVDDGNNPSLEEQIIALACISGNITRMNEIKKMTVYQFITALKRYNLIESSRMYGSAIATGMVEIKGDIPTWLSPTLKQNSLDRVTESGDKIEEFKGMVE